MYLPFRIRSKYIIVIIIFVFYLFSPGRSIVQNLFVFFAKELIFTPYRSKDIIEKLQQQQLIDTLKIRQLKNLEEENKLLKKALQFKEEKKVELVGGEIIFFDPCAFKRIVVVNVGLDKNITKGLYVVDEEGYLLGRVMEVSKNYCKIMLITDPDFALPVFVGDNSLGLLKGGGEEVKILYLENDENIKNQDKVWVKTNFLGLPVLYIGEVSNVKNYKNSLFLEVRVKSFYRNPFIHKIFIMR